MVRFFKRVNTVIFLLFIVALTALNGIQAQEQSQDDLAMALSSTKVDYLTHVSQIGWQSIVQDGATAGTTGQGLAIEAIRINLENSSGISPGTVQYSLHCQDIGWTPVASNGELAGTEGQSKKAQAITINLTGDISNQYDIYYRVHSAYYGWLDWAKNGEVAGTTGIDTAAEALEIRLVNKNDPAPGPTARPNVTYESLAQNAYVEYDALGPNGWYDPVANGADAGTVGAGLPIYGIKAIVPNRTDPECRLEYTLHCTDIGWIPQTFADNQEAVGGGHNIEAICMDLKGIDGYSYDVYYQVHVQDFGWLGWAKNGEIAGTTGGGKRIEALRVVLRPKGGPAPGLTDNSYVQIIPPENWAWPFDASVPQNISSSFAWRWGRMHNGVDIAVPRGSQIKACKSGTVIRAGSYGDYGLIVIIRNDSGEDVYYAHMDAINTVVGRHVTQGEIIGFAGSTGNATGPHLHLGVVVNGSFIDPMSLF